MSIATPPSVLIVQNDPDLRALIVNMMHDVDADVASASTGRLAAVMIVARHYDLALIDVALPDMAWSALASLAADMAIPAVLTSRHAGTVAQLRHHDKSCLQTPFRAEELRDVSCRAIRDGAINILKVKASIAVMEAASPVSRSDVGKPHRMLAEPLGKSDGRHSA